ncbi:hypothetical protein [Mesobacillus thioparans]
MIFYQKVVNDAIIDPECAINGYIGAITGTQAAIIASFRANIAYK